MKKILIVFLVALVLTGCFAAAIYLLNNYNYTNPADWNNSNNSNIISENYAVEVIDGDTFILNNGEIIRLLCVDTPEKGKTGYEDAENYLSSIVLGKNIMIKRENLDRYNRTLAWVYSKENDNFGNFSNLINKKIIDNKLGVIFEYNNTNCSKIK